MTSLTSPRELTPGLLRDALAGLSASPRTLPCKHLYDAQGSALFDRICDLPEYYLTRTETAILRTHLDAIAARVTGDRPPHETALIELGSGSSTKTRLLLDRLRGLGAYVPIDISADHLAAAARALRARYPGLPVLPVAADYTAPLHLPDLPPAVRRRVLFFPGSTIGNFPPDEAATFLTQLRHTTTSTARQCGAAPSQEHVSLLLGFDLRKDPSLLLPAYDDPQGVTAAFNLNLLARLNREAGADFDPDAFAHEARWNDAESRIEMHLVSLADQTVRLAGRSFAFRAGESIHTESSYKHSPEAMHAIAARAGWRPAETWTDPDRLFAVQFLTARA